MILVIGHDHFTLDMFWQNIDTVTHLAFEYWFTRVVVVRSSTRLTLTHRHGHSMLFVPYIYSSSAKIFPAFFADR
jgi:hypothetical protein